MRNGGSCFVFVSSETGNKVSKFVVIKVSDLLDGEDSGALNLFIAGCLEQLVGSCSLDPFAKGSWDLESRQHLSYLVEECFRGIMWELGGGKYLLMAN